MSEQDAEIESLMQEGSALHRDGKIGRAELAYKAVLKLQRNHPGALHLQGVITCQRGDIDKGIRLINRALAVQPSFPDALSSLASIYLNAGDHAKALETVERAVSQGASNPALLQTQAAAQIKLSDFDGACATYERLDVMKPDDPGIVGNWATALLALERYGEAEAMFARVTALEPENSNAWCYRAQALKGQGRFAEALETLENILSRDHEYVPAMIHAGDALQALGRDDDAMAHFRRAITVQPDHAEAHFNLGVSLLTQGKYEEGWPEYAWRFRMDAYAGFRPPIPVPIWSGEPLVGKRILIFSEQGLGDTIQFARYASPLSEQGAEVHCLCSDLVHDVVATIDGIAGVHGSGETLPKPDFQISMMELPHVFGSDASTIPKANGYIHAPLDKFRPKDGFSVGLVWKGNWAHKNDAYRSIPLQLFDGVLENADINFYSLQFGDAADDIASLGWQDRIENLAPEISNFADTADIASKLDLVITVDTSVAHLVGALGVPVWVMLAAIPDWRWGRAADKTCWYTSMRLFRQRDLGNWDDVFANVNRSISEMRDGPKA